MKSALRPYQNDLYISARDVLKTNKSVLIQLATGGGKTPIMASMCESVYDNEKIAWIIVNREELIKQSSDHLRKWGVPHGKITAGTNESKAYKIQVVSSDTLIRRYDKIKQWPDLCIIDECHLMLDRQVEFLTRLPEKTKVIGFTATPERADGRGLSKKADGVYDEIVYGPSIPELTRQGYLTSIKYYAPPLEGIDNLKRIGTEVDEEELEKLLERKKIYGDLVSHYQKFGNNKSALIFCRGIKSSEHAAERFRDRGYKFYSISSKTPHAERVKLIQAINDGSIQGLCGCDIFIYGLDVPRIEYAATIRPTESRAVYMQSVGRVLRPWINPITGYKKEEALFFDHVNNILSHQDDKYPGIPLHYVPEIAWNFDGTEKRKKSKADKNVKLCQYLDFMYCTNVHCQTCEHNPDKSVTDARRQMVIVPAELEEIKKPVALADRDLPERRQIESDIIEQVLKYKSDENELPSVIDALVKIADECGYSPFWIYHQLVTENKHAVQIHILAAIQRAKNFKPGWIYFAKEKIKSKGA